MKKKAINPLLLGAIVLGAICAYLLHSFVSKKDQELAALNAKVAELANKANIPVPVVSPTAVSLKKIVVAAIPIPMGKMITAQDLTTKDVPLDMFPNSTSDPDAILNEPDPDRPGAKRLTRNRAKVMIEINTPVDSTKYARQLDNLQDRLSPGMRGLVLQNINDMTGGVLVDGSPIDLLFTYNDPVLGERTQIVAQNIRVFVSPTASPERADPKLMDVPRGGGFIFEVTPEQSELLVQLSRAGTYGMILRNPKDKEIATARGISKQEILDNPRVVQSRTLRSLLKAEEIRKALDAAKPAVEEKK